MREFCQNSRAKATNNQRELYKFQIHRRERGKRLTSTKEAFGGYRDLIRSDMNVRLFPDYVHQVFVACFETS